jgi:hypothetical protein
MAVNINDHLAVSLSYWVGYSYGLIILADGGDG